MPAKLRRLDGLIADLVAEHESAHEAMAEGRIPGPQIPWPKVARELGGYWPVGMFGVNAAPGCGKSAFAFQLAAEARCPALIVSCEMGALSVLRRLIARATGTFKGKLAPDKSTGLQIEQLAKRTAEKCPDVAILGAARDPVTFAELRDHAIAVRGDHKHLLLIVDSLHAWSSTQAAYGETEYGALNRALIDLRSLSEELRCTVLFVAHQAKAVVREGGGGIAAAAGTRRIEYDVDGLLELRRPARDDDEDRAEVEDRPPDAEADDIVVVFSKNRDWGRAGAKIPMRFEGRLQSFREATAIEIMDSRARQPRRRQRNAG